MAVPEAVLDHWNSPSKLPAANCITIGNRSQKIVKHMHGDLEPKESKCMSSKCRQTPVISIAIPSENSCLYSSQRQAKVEATEKIKHSLSELSMKEKGVRRRLSMNLNDHQNRQSKRRGPVRRNGSVKSSSLASSRSDRSSSSSESMTTHGSSPLPFNEVGPFSSPSPSVVSVRDFTIELTRVTCRPPSVSRSTVGRHARRLAECKVQRLSHCVHVK